MPIFRGAPPNFSGRKKRNSLLRRERESEERKVEWEHVDV